MTPGSGPADGRDGDGVRLRPILAILAILILAAALATAWSWQLCRGGMPIARLRTSPPERLAGVEFGLIDRADGARERLRRQRRQLATYGWLPGEPGVAHIPIEAATRAWLDGEGR